MRGSRHHPDGERIAWGGLVSAAFLNILVGLATSVLSGGSVWLWQRARNTRILRRKVAFFGVERGGTCLIIMNNTWDTPRRSTHHDVQAMIEVATLANEVGCAISVHSCDEFRESNGNRTEFCIGGPESNPRTGGHLTSRLPGVTVRPYHATRRDSAAIVVGDQRFLLDLGNQEYVLVAKFTLPEASRPIILICGQTPITNRAAIHYLKREYRGLSRVVASVDQFCIMVRVASTGTYGYQAAGLECDVSAAAFGGH
jgi:hypothetical protein